MECSRLSPSESSPVPEEMSLSELRQISGTIDDEHRFFLKAIAKTGCTSWKTILYNNSRGVHLTKPLRHPHRVFKKYGMHKMFSEPSKEIILKKLRDYYLMLNVRHPLQRLESVFREKVVRQNGLFYQRVKHLVKGDATMFSTFLDMILKRKGKGDQHVRSYLHHDVCSLNFSYISKLETATHDMDYIIRNRLSNKGRPIVVHSTGNTAIPKTVIPLPYFSRLNWTDQLKASIEKLYGWDFRAFGYTYRVDESTGDVTGFCDYIKDGLCC